MSNEQQADIIIQPDKIKNRKQDQQSHTDTAPKYPMYCALQPFKLNGLVNAFVDRNKYWSP